MGGACNHACCSGCLIAMVTAAAEGRCARRRPSVDLAGSPVPRRLLASSSSPLLASPCLILVCSDCDVPTPPLSAYTLPARCPSIDVDDVKCVVPDCRVPMPAALMAELVPQSLYSLWEARKKEKLLLKLPGLQYCPRCDPSSADFKNRNGRSSGKHTLCSFFREGQCQKGRDCKFAHGTDELAPTPTAVPCLPVSDGSGDDTLCICPECRYTFCAVRSRHTEPSCVIDLSVLLCAVPYLAPCPTLRRASPVLCRPCAFVSFVLPPQACHDAYHPGVECVSSAAREEYLRTREKLLREQGGTGGEAQERLLAARAKLEELKSLDAIRQMSKPCPACGVASEYLRMRRIQCVASNANPRPLLLQPALKRA